VIGESCGTYSGVESYVQGIGGEHERNKPFLSRRVWDNIKMYLQEKSWDGGAWTEFIWLGTGGGFF